MTELYAGASSTDITPKNSQFLYGYPHVPRYSTGTHDPLYTAALYLANWANDDPDGAAGGAKTGGQALFISNDLIHFSKEQVSSIRRRIANRIPIPEDCILVSASHTHSGPIMVFHLNSVADPVVPLPDPEYFEFAAELISANAEAAYNNSTAADFELAVADGSCVGTNRRDPAGVADPEVPVLVASARDSGTAICCMVTCNMHPTVLHEDSTLFSSDFPGATRSFLQSDVFGRECVILYNTGPSGNQSPRHVTRGNTFEEADRLGVALGKAIGDAVQNREVIDNPTIEVSRTEIELSPRVFPSPGSARENLNRVENLFTRLKDENAPSQEIRTAECDWFGAEETVALADSQADGSLSDARRLTMPAEIQVIRVGNKNFVGWPCEIFVEYGLAIKEKYPGTFVISLANGETQGYIVTPEAEAEGGYEASNGLFASDSGRILVQSTSSLLAASSNK